MWPPGTENRSPRPPCRLLIMPAARPAGFPVTMPAFRPPGYVARPGQEIVGFDFACAGSVLPGACALPSGLGAILVCSREPQCQAVVVYSQGERWSCQWGVWLVWEACMRQG